jgi:uncharacterized coiled-coil protein SlyX
MDINPVALAKIEELEAEIAERDALIGALESLLTSTEVKLSLALAQNALMMSDRMYTHESHAD